MPRLGQSWIVKGNLQTLSIDQGVYAAQYEATSARMKAGDWSMLCPTSPDLNIPLLFMLIQLKEATRAHKRVKEG